MATNQLSDIERRIAKLDSQKKASEIEAKSIASELAILFGNVDNVKLFNTRLTQNTKTLREFWDKRVKATVDGDADGSKPAAAMDITDAKKLLDPYRVSPSDPLKKKYNEGGDAIISSFSPDEMARFKELELQDINKLVDSSTLLSEYKKSITKRHFVLNFRKARNATSFGGGNDKPTGITVTGPPGSGKTDMFLNFIGKELPHINLYFILSSAVKDSKVGESGKKIAAIYAAANAIQLERQKLSFGDYNGVTILVFDEGDNLIQQPRSGGESGGDEVMIDIAKTMQQVISLYQDTVFAVMIANFVDNVADAMKRRLLVESSIVIGAPTEKEVETAFVYQLAQISSSETFGNSPTLAAINIEAVTLLIERVLQIVNSRFPSIRTNEAAMFKSPSDYFMLSDVGRIKQLIAAYFKEVESLSGSSKVVCSFTDPTSYTPIRFIASSKTASILTTVIKGFNVQDFQIDILQSTDSSLYEFIFPQLDDEIERQLMEHKPVTPTKDVNAFISRHPALIVTFVNDFKRCNSIGETKTHTKKSEKTRSVSLTSDRTNRYRVEQSSSSGFTPRTI